MTHKDKNTLQKFLKALQPEIKILIKKSNRIADVGYGRANLLKLLNKKYNKNKKNLYGYDINIKYFKKIKNIFPNLKQKDFSKKNTFKNKFDLVFALDTIEHIPKPNVFIQNIDKIIKSKGYLVLSTPNINSLSHFLMQNNWFGYQDKSHQVFFTLKSIKVLLKKHYFKIIKLKTISTSAYPAYDYLISHTKLGGSIILIAQKND
jgi:2-polyprenyl-3-methyl-5-hydroxy-6-metoxy-1,4-benzoquinol methylase